MPGILGSTPSYFERGAGLLGQAAQTYAMQQKKGMYQDPGKTVGGGLLSGAAMGSAGATLAPVLGTTGPWGLAIGGVVGLAAYLLS